MSDFLESNQGQIERLQPPIPLETGTLKSAYKISRYRTLVAVSLENGRFWLNTDFPDGPISLEDQHGKPAYESLINVLHRVGLITTTNRDRHLRDIGF